MDLAPDSTLFVIDHREPVLRISRTHVVGARGDTFAIVLTTDGREVAVESFRSPDLDCDSRWWPERVSPGGNG